MLEDMSRACSYAVIPQCAMIQQNARVIEAPPISSFELCTFWLPGKSSTYSITSTKSNPVRKCEVTHAKENHFFLAV